MTNTALGIIFPNMHDSAIPELTGHRTMASVPVAGRYRLIDFMLSSMTNCGIENVGVVVKSNYLSLMDHLGNGREWDLSRKRGGLTIFPPYGKEDNKVYHGRVEALGNILGYLSHKKEDYVILCDCDILCNLDYQALLDAHVESGAEVTMVYEQVEAGCRLPRSNVGLTLGEDGRVTELLFDDDRCVAGRKVAMGITVIERELLITIVKDALVRNCTRFEKDILAPSLKVLTVRGYRHTGYHSCIFDMKSYYDTNRDMLDRAVLNELFCPERPVYTKVRDEAPVRYALDCRVSNCTVADGCIIEGEAENCVLFRGVKIKKGAKVKDCVLMQNTVVEENACLTSVITDKDVTVTQGQQLTGNLNYPVFIRKGFTV